MNKDAKTFGIAITTLGLFCSLCYAFTVGNNTIGSAKNDGSNNQYVLNLGSEKNRSNISKSISKIAIPSDTGEEDGDSQGTFDAITENGNTVTFGYKNVNFSSNSIFNPNTKNWGVFNPNSALYNITAINGMSSISVEFSNTDSLNLAYGWIDKATGEAEYNVDEITLTPENSTFDFHEDGPDVFKVYNNSSAAVPLADVVISYSCSETLNPYWTSTEGEFIYDYVPSNGEYTIKGYSGTDTDIVVPCKIFDGVNSAYVTEIADDAFKNYYLQTLSLPSTVVSIGDSAFYNCSSLTSASLPNNLQEIGDYAFYACGQLTNFNIPNSVTSIGEGAFSSCYLLTSISLPNNLNTIEAKTFENCHQLTNVVLPDSVIALGSYAFKNCYNLASVNLSSNLQAICSSAFESCQQLKSIDMPDGVTAIGSSAFKYCYNLSSVELSKDLVSIGETAFGGCGALTKIDIPDSVTSIDKKAFENCYNLATIIIPTSVQNIANNAFNGVNWDAKFFYEGSALSSSVKSSLNGIKSKLYFYSETPNTDGRHWHYVQGEPTIW